MLRNHNSKNESTISEDAKKHKENIPSFYSSRLWKTKRPLLWNAAKRPQKLAPAYHTTYCGPRMIS